MLQRRTQNGWSTLAPAKINLSLEIIGRRADGLHELESLLAPVRLYDRLHLTPLGAGAGIELRVHRAAGRVSSVADAPEGAANLVHAAIARLESRTNRELPCRIDLWKRIPSEAGMGGGSSDAAAALGLANTAFNLRLTSVELSGLAAEIGSDVPFFLAGRAAICRGRGEVVEPAPRLGSLACVIAKPPVGLATAAVFGRLNAPDAHGATSSLNSAKLVTAIRERSWPRVRRLFDNQLQRAAAELSPWIEKLHRAFSGLPFIAHQMTGSGTAYFGLCHNGRDARRLAGALRAMGAGFVFATRTC